jgi:hypothetical protein
MKKDKLLSQVNKSRLVSSQLTHNVFASNLRGGITENLKTATCNFGLKVTSNINQEKNEMFKKTNIVFDNNNLLQPLSTDEGKFSTIRTFQQQDHLKNYKDVVTQPKKFSTIRLKQAIDKKENFQAKKSNKYERFYNDTPSAVLSEAKKIKIDSLYKRTSLDYNKIPFYGYENPSNKKDSNSHYNTIDVNGREYPTVLQNNKVKAAKERDEMIRNTLIKRPLGPANEDKINNKSTRVLTESINDLRKTFGTKSYRPKKTFSYAFNNFTDKNKSGFYC